MKSRRISARSQVFCDKCSGVITIEAASVKTKRFLDGIQFDYFRCSHCGEAYVTLVTDAELRKDIIRRGFRGTSARMKLRAEALKKEYIHRVKELP